MPHTIDDLRTHLFDTLKALRDKDNPMDVERAKAVAQVADVIVETAKVEVRHLEVTGGKGSGFIPEHPALPAPGPAGSVPRIGGTRR
ncbi:MAG TPA: hypothetical protein VFB54_07420 [Burkholderiales bacterium]|nr:hypothetical protein [Burkholderiales bacterium]